MQGVLLGWCGGVKFDQIGVIGVFGQHKIKAVKSRTCEPAGDFYRGIHHFGMCDAANHRGVARGMTLLQYRKVEAG
jgi:hypothetical protein